MSPRFTHLDAADTVFFARELERIKAKTYDKRYPELKGRLFIPTSNETPAGATEVTYEQWDRVGRSKIIKPGATDSPRVDVNALQFSRPVRWGGNSYGWTVIDIMQARLAGKPLDSRKAMASRRAHEELIDEVAAIGAPDYGIATGFLNNANVTVQAAASGVWSAASADNIIADVSLLVQNQATETLGVEKADTLVLPEEQYALIKTKPRATGTDTTVLEYIVAKFGIAVEAWYRLNQAGAASVDRAVFYRRDEDFVQQEIPQEYMALPVHQHGANFSVEALVATAGTTFYYPKSARYLDGI
jgi:hypothetical protein